MQDGQPGGTKGSSRAPNHHTDSPHPHAFHVTTTVSSLDKKITSSADAQIDSRCTRLLIDRSFAKKLGLAIQSLALPLEVKGCNNTVLDHIDGKVDVRLRIGNHEEARTL